MTTETQDISEQTVIEPTAMELKKEELKTEVVQVEPTEETADVEETEEAEEEKTLEDATDLISAGTQALALANYEEAAEKLALAVEIQVSHLGQYALEVAPSFHLYGKALLQAAIVKNSVLGEKADQVKPMEQSSSKTDSKIVFEESDLEDEGQDLNDLEEPADDLELAWENLDVARLILSKQSEKEYILQLADVHLSLGDVSLESENFDQACKDYELALKLKMEHALENHRELAEVHFKLALALEYSEQFEVAMEEVQAAMDCLNKRIKEVEGKTDKEEAELKGFLVELEAKLLDLQTLIEKEDQGEKITTEEQKAPAVVNDISNLVKKATTVSPKKRKQEETEDAEKKLKVE